MKKIGIFLTGMVAVSTLTASAQDGYSYSKLFEEGKVWNVVEEYYNASTHETSTVNQQVSVSKEYNDGDRLVTELNCFNQQTNTFAPFTYMEEDGVIYVKSSDEYLKAIDFNLVKGDLVPVLNVDDNSITSNYYVVKDEIVDIRGIGRRILSIGDEKDGSQFTYWIEGIGSVDDCDMLAYPMPTCETYLESRHITSCYVNDKCIFSREDLDDYISKSGVKVAGEIGDVVSSEYYDLTGNRLAAPAKGVSIRVDLLSDGTRKAVKVMK